MFEMKKHGRVERLLATAEARTAISIGDKARYLLGCGVSQRTVAAKLKMSRSSLQRAVAAVSKGRPPHRVGRPPLVEHEARERVVSKIAETQQRRDEDLSEEQVLKMVCLSTQKISFQNCIHTQFALPFAV